jgi:shikimate kinase
MSGAAEGPFGGYYGYDPPRPLRRPVCVIGLMGSEAQTVTYSAASLTGYPLIDLDAQVEHGAGRSLSALYALEGPGGWRARELDALRRALRASPTPLIALGDGALLSGEARALRQANATLVYIRRPLSECLTGLARAHARSPFRFPFWPHQPPSSPSELAPLLAARLPAYEEAEVILEGEGKGSLELATALVAWLAEVAATS